MRVTLEEVLSEMPPHMQGKSNNYPSGGGDVAHAEPAVVGAKADQNLSMTILFKVSIREIGLFL